MPVGPDDIVRQLRGISNAPMATPKQRLAEACIDAANEIDKMRNSLSCPFCQSSDFDLIGLKHHLVAGHCDEFEKVRALGDYR